MHFVVHAGLFAAAVVAWMPVRSPTPALPRLRPPQQMLYLFFHSILPTIPASFLTFSSVALYPVYGDAALAWGLDPVSDQTIAGVIMKLAGGLLLWIAIAIIWFRWVAEERQWDQLEADLRSTPTA
jgi:putative membrane protein